MFQNCVFKVSVSTRDWAKKAGIRAVKTMAQTPQTIWGFSHTKKSFTFYE